MKTSNAHLPTWLLIIGYPIFWGEMWLHPGPHTTFLATSLFLLVAFQNLKNAELVRPALRQWPWVLLGGIILVVAAYAATRPPHLLQESDALNYHIGLPRQHLIQGTFAHLPWSSADLWLLPIQFALSPYWLCTALPNKFPQFIFLLGLLAVMRRLGKKMQMSPHAQAALMAAILGSHGLGIQFGTAMLDIVISYLALAALDSFLSENWGLAAIEGSFFVWSKAFMPLQIGMVLVAFGVLELARRRMDFEWTFSFSLARLRVQPKFWRRFGVGAVMASLLIGGPFVGKSLYYAGTPLFPFAPFHLAGTLAKDPMVKASVVQASTGQQSTRNSYGKGRSFSQFIRHFWMNAFPETGVNNAYDYPLGLPYLLLLGPFLVLLVAALRRRQWPFLPVLTVLLWGIWWSGSQQSRWLFLPMLLIFLSTLSIKGIARNKVLGWGLSCALLLADVSIIRAHWPDIKDPSQIMRPQDVALMKVSRQWKGPGPLRVNMKEIAFAECPVDVVSDDSYWVLKP